jgi:hypothetical protein
MAMVTAAERVVVVQGMRSGLRNAFEPVHTNLPPMNQELPAGPRRDQTRISCCLRHSDRAPR